jgi:hypothetical protein
VLKRRNRSSFWTRTQERLYTSSQRGTQTFQHVVTSQSMAMLFSRHCLKSEVYTLCVLFRDLSLLPSSYKMLWILALDGAEICSFCKPDLKDTTEYVLRHYSYLMKKLHSFSETPLGFFMSHRMIRSTIQVVTQEFAFDLESVLLLRIPAVHYLWTFYVVKNMLGWRTVTFSSLIQNNSFL